MSRGEKESSCLETVKSALFYNKGKPVCNPFDCHSYLDVDDATLRESIYFTAIQTSAKTALGY